MKNAILPVLALVLLGNAKCFAQYPKISPEVQAQQDAIIKEANKLSDQAWEKALLVIEEQAKQGKPFIPWASRPDDLPQAKIPAFPGAEGGGMYSFGGRGGKVYTVTSLEDRGPGTLREALEQGGARIIVFNVAGIIKLKSPLIVRAPYVTIAGQTAPGDGICVAGETIWIDTHDVVIRHMRFRRGETFVGRRDDAIGGNPVGNIIIDHVSATWGLDENMSFYRHMYNDGTGKPESKFPTVNVTIQNSLFAEGLDTYNHAFGSTLGGENCSFLRNMWSSNTGRNPSIGWNGVFNFVNNVVFNWVNRSIDGGDYTAKYNIINNYFKPGPATNLNEPISYRILKPESGRSKLSYMVFGRAYVNGNVVEGNAKVSKDNWDGGVQMENKKGEQMSFEEASTYFPKMRVNDPMPMPWFDKVMTAEETYAYVTKNAGATFPIRDKVDTRIVRVVQTGKPEYNKAIEGKTFYQFEHRRLPMDSYKLGIITDISQVGGYPEYKGKPYVDTDKDGIPDVWEKKYGLNPKDPSDAQGDLNGDGYSNIEDYINGVNPAIKVDWKDLANNKETLVRPLLDLN
ncbi:pectate lyase family protein [Flavobacterium gilvum]|uniref:Polysaccharide lyase n=1 Tax=Flavobacterium gilvum TaxID=1492737 RepID=A0AAC9N375_9FLAO|nr:polysaccharide lyase [Flavobacterium gilvum]AOW08275.1 polysaccharide lyase [Flavobacterium gilvum]KFC59380.1 polysaccharide lyase [Flavobacterium gilvum]